ncbi:protein ARV1 [Leptidea sinapis]|uniref:protein ARV1 n=1 Tax=Leptidea sinapis TaxID=189913 RepID=UPI0021399F91|nr:protein ARV1 [Leptidea sinapis]
MIKNSQFKCVNCGAFAEALYRTYGPSVLKLTKCEICNGIVDKYIEYDPVIVMIDLVLMSKEAQRHVIFNTDFKAYWKLFIILMLLETYGVWRNDSLFNIVINSMCDIKNNSTINTTYIGLPIELSLPETVRTNCNGWVQVEKDDVDLFIWEKDFYIQFLSTFAGILVFMAMVHGSIVAIKAISSKQKVSLVRALKAYSLANCSLLLTLPMLVWGNADTSPTTRLLHYALVYLYSFTVFFNIFVVLYESPRMLTLLVLAASYLMKYTTMFLITPAIRTLHIYRHSDEMTASSQRREF